MTTAPPELYTNRAIIRYRLNDLQRAMADYTSAIDMDGTNEIALYNRALLRSRVGISIMLSMISIKYFSPIRRTTSLSSIVQLSATRSVITALQTLTSIRL